MFAVEFDQHTPDWSSARVSGQTRLAQTDGAGLRKAGILICNKNPVAAVTEKSPSVQKKKEIYKNSIKILKLK